METTRRTPNGSRWRALGIALACLAAAEVLAAAVFALRVGWSWTDAIEAFTVTNATMGASFAACGAVLVWQRPNNAVGWILTLGGLGHATSGMCAPLAVLLAEAGAPMVAQRTTVTIFLFAWPWSIGLWLPLVLMIFPDGRPVTRGWRWVIALTALTAPVFVASSVGYPAPPASGVPSGYLSFPSYDRFAPLWMFAEFRTLGALLLALVALGIRYRRGDELVRRQLLWLLLATVIVIATTAAWGLVAGTPIGVLFTIPLIPVAITIAILRHRLLDIRLVVARSLVYLVLSSAVLAAYVGLVALLGDVFGASISIGALAAFAVAIVFVPARNWLQSHVDHAMYGDRRNPARAMSEIGERLTGESGDELATVLEALRTSLRLPYVAVSTQNALVASAGAGTPSTARLPLHYAGCVVGELVVGLRRGESRLAAADHDALSIATAPLALALHATELSRQLQSSRELLVTSREEERRRLRRELHDGLGPVLTGVALSADAAANLMGADPEEAQRLLASLRSQARGAIDDIRRLVYDLRPPALDELGLIGALRQRAEQLAAPCPIEVHDADLPRLPAAVEVAAYRIATEAMTNAVRHSSASHIEVRLWSDGALHVDVSDDGAPANGQWRTGVGLTVMHERAAELGGRCEALATPAGGRVCARLPVEVT